MSRRTAVEARMRVGTHPESEVAREAGGYWRRRGLPTRPEQVAVAPGVELMLLAVLAAAGQSRGGVLLPRPCAGWHAAQARLLGRSVHPVPVPAECGGVPDPFALLETVRRARRHGPAPGVLLLSVADDPTGTAVPPELLHEVCEAAADEDLLIVSDESWRDTSHRPHDTVTVSPAEMLHTAAGDADRVCVLVGTEAALLPDGPAAGLARFPDTESGRDLADTVRRTLRALGAQLPEAAAGTVAAALAEPPALREARTATALTHGRAAAALHRVVSAAGGLSRPPHVGRHLYADLEPLRSGLAAAGVVDAAGLEAALVLRMGPFALGGHRFGEDPAALHVRLSTAAALPVRTAGHAADDAGQVAVPEPLTGWLHEVTGPACGAAPTHPDDRRRA